MVESLLNPSNVLLYGRVLNDLQLVFGQSNTGTPPPTGLDQNGNAAPVDDLQPPPCIPAAEPLPIPPQPPRMGSNNFLQGQLSAPGARLARIYGFSYDGQYFDVTPPAIFLVHGDGADPEAFRPSHTLPNARTSRAPADADRTGIAYTDSSFAEDIRVWSYDKGDFTVRLDPSSGTFDDVLLSYELGGDMGSFAGANARGANARGANARGANARGANARGANARGANARGANARGSSD